MNKVAVITGAARGIGKAIALKFASQGYHVVINYRGSEEKANAVKEQCIALGVEALTYQGDVSHYQEMEDMMKAVMEKFGRIDVLVNNSGITKDQLLLKMDSESFMDVIDVNLKGTFNTIKAVSRIMMKQKSGVIINMSSVIGEIGNAGQANYAASKAGVLGLTKSIAKEFAPRHIRVNAIAPGFIATDMTDVLNEQTKENILQAIPLKSLGEAEDVANVAYFLASDDAKYITGQVINVDGGMVM
ncbi:MAG: 3-oxoacyl-[acyl-carrier-protein] reductase [Longibaculum muris]|uniref:3-oxoacyl-[acyl-carrier-protein] reductase n=1 Tax=Longibaculum muris TaxID=1796628 RepID=A0A4V2W5W9_9FIRM|nr:3-oxoacyl-[acyl-carrier-protein] reductase [Longibaculum muris]KXU51823.1 3-oxoacyl-[acyl-carrier-protein] reductase [Candidatus Stoquefichus sp. KLE1796]MBS5369287.1 3-oxoacyl-[acyl-carrier-protein] reductase [Coprobacillus cateniformis]MCR1886481.1 3-oxoacyl-[acyl-carrier-protein] reductase [Longibaculum muris]MED9811053.1 3-oxoacyl-[acyl-carrier-protein] reductase [Longibaculum muris]TCW02722.1 3-oxoacyl-[acyl-carrier-protein] reductase [Longibaculum muris]